MEALNDILKVMFAIMLYDGIKRFFAWVRDEYGWMKAQERMDKDFKDLASDITKRAEERVINELHITDQFPSPVGLGLGVPDKLLYEIDYLIEQSWYFGERVSIKEKLAVIEKLMAKEYLNDKECWIRDNCLKIRINTGIPSNSSKRYKPKREGCGIKPQHCELGSCNYPLCTSLNETGE